MGKKTEEYDPLNKKQIIKTPLVQPPFRICWFHNQVCPRLTVTDRMTATEKLNLTFSKHKIETQIAKYVVALAQVGAILQDAFDKLNKERIVDVKALVPMIEFKDHPLINESIFPVHVNYGRHKGKPVTDDVFLIWHTVLTDLLFQLGEHLKHFVVFVESHQIPSFAELRRASSSQE